MDKWLGEYRKKFGEQFPLMLCMGMSDEQIINTIKKCLENETPYEVSEDADY